MLPYVRQDKYFCLIGTTVTLLAFTAIIIMSTSSTCLTTTSSFNLVSYHVPRDNEVSTDNFKLGVSLKVLPLLIHFSKAAHCSKPQQSTDFLSVPSWSWTKPPPLQSTTTHTPTFSASVSRITPLSVHHHSWLQHRTRSATASRSRSYGWKPQAAPTTREAPIQTVLTDLFQCHLNEQMNAFSS